MASHRLARQLNTSAFTVGHDIFFARGRANGDSPRLLAHELSHTLDAESDVVRRAPPDAIPASVPRIELEGKSDEEIARQVYDAYRCVVPSAFNQILVQLVPLSPERISAVTVHVEWLMQHPPVDPPKPKYTRSDAYYTSSVASELATMAGIPTDLLEHHRKVGDHLQNLATPPAEAAAGYQPDHSGKQYYAKHPLPDSLLKRIDAVFLPGLNRAFAKKPKAKQAVEGSRG